MEPSEEELNAQLNAVEGEEQEVQEVEGIEQEAEQEQPNQAQKQETEDDEDRPLTRGQKRIQALANEKETARREAELAKQQADFYRAQLEAAQRQQQPQEDLDPMQKWQRDTNLALQQHQRMTLDLADKADFKMEVADNPTLRQYADQVETRLQQFRMQGGNPTRAQVLTVILGEQMRANLAKAPKVKAEAAARVKQAAGKPLSTPTSVASGKRDASLYDRLKDISI